MGLIKEPKGVTFTVEKRDLTTQERILLKQFIAEQRRKNKSKSSLKSSSRLKSNRKTMKIAGKKSYA